MKISIYEFKIINGKEQKVDMDIENSDALVAIDLAQIVLSELHAKIRNAV